MDVIREHLVYANVPLHVCMGSLTRQEQYECLRALFSSSNRNVTICLDHGEVSDYVRQVLRALNILEGRCLRVT